MTPHDVTHENSLEELLTRDDADAAALIAQRADECALCKAHIDEYLATVAALDASLAVDFSAVDQAQDEIVRASRLAPRGSREDVIEAGIRAGILPESARRPRRGFLVPAAALSAAALALVAFWLARTHTEPADRPPTDVPAALMLSRADDDVKELAPAGVVPAFDTFTWSDDASDANGESYTLIIESTDRTDGEGRPVELRIPDLMGASYSLSAAEQQAIGRSIRWEVRICDAGGRATTRRGTATASLTPR